ncbi:MAG TPA: GtrA family protein [Ktedonobacteraceae bacterium]|nr:GtrA family protein [Ktedonobacteraceae bacterium]
MKAIREANAQEVSWVQITWGRHKSYLRTRDEVLSKLDKEKSTGKPIDEALGQFVRFCVVGTSNAVIDFGVLDMALALFPTRATVPLLAYNTVAVVLAATNSFVWNRRFTFHVRGPLQITEVVRFIIVAAGTAVLNDLVLLLLSGFFPSLMASGALGANVLKLGAILGAMALSFFGMRLWVFVGMRLSSSSKDDIAS